MKKSFLIFNLLFFGIIFNSFSQTTTSSDFYAGKWEIFIKDSPLGDVKFHTNLVRKDGKLTGELSYVDEPDKEKRPITKIEEKGDNLSIFFISSQGGELSIDLKKENDNLLKGSIMGYETTMTRLKE
jgi:hypothetical protein